MQENVYVTNAITANTTPTTGSISILKPQGPQNSVCIDNGGKVVYRFPTTAPTRESTTLTPKAATSSFSSSSSAWEKKEPINGKKKHVDGDNVVNDCMRMKVTLPSFWPAFLANIGICALLIGYIFIGSFLFMSIENDESNIVTQNEKQFSWNIVSSNQANKLHQFQEQEQQQLEIINNVHFAHNNNHTMNEQVLLKAAAATTNNLKSNIQQITNTQRRLNMRNNFEGDNDREFQHTSHVNDAVEGSHDNVEAAERQRTVENIWEITVSLNILYKENWTRLAALELARFQNHLMKRLTLDLMNNHHTRNPTASIKAVKEYYKQHSTLSTRQVEWRFSTAFLYSLTLISTVGYGTLTPHTALGRAVTIAYGTFGIPLMLIYLSSVGSILGKLMRFWCTGIFCCCSCCCSSEDRQKGNNMKHKRKSTKNEIQMKQPPQTSQPHLSYCYVRPPIEISPETGTATTSSGTSVPFALGSSFDTLSIGTHDSRHYNAFGWSLILPVILCLILWLFYITIGSIVISLLEQWPLIDGIYFCFMSLTTIGFCDLLPGLSGKSTITKDVLYPSYSSNIAVWFCALYILIGLTLISMCVNMLHEEIIWRMQIVVKRNTLPYGKDSKRKQSTFFGGGLP